MKDDSKVHIKLPSEFSSTITVDDASYTVLTEDMGSKRAEVVTKIFMGGEVVKTRKSGYGHLLNQKDRDIRLRQLMLDEHDAVSKEFMRDQSKKIKSKKEYFDEANRLFRRGGGQAALELVKEGLDKYPADPFLLSYYGCLLASAGKDPVSGISICRESLDLLEKSVPFGSDFFRPFFYLNLGRAYLAAGDKAGAINVFREALKLDPDNSDVLWEWKKMGVRRRPPVSFLRRGNFVNKYLGLVLNKVKGRNPDAF